MSLCGFKVGQTKASLSGVELGADGMKLLASDFLRDGVGSSLTSLSVNSRAKDTVGMSVLRSCPFVSDGRSCDR